MRISSRRERESREGVVVLVFWEVAVELIFKECIFVVFVVVLLLGVYLKNCRTGLDRYLCIVFRVGLLVIVKRWA